MRVRLEPRNGLIIDERYGCKEVETGSGKFYRWDPLRGIVTEWSGR